MRYKKVFVLLFVLVFQLQLFSQQSATYTSNFVDYQKALTLYNNSQYLAAQSMFSQIKKRTDDAVMKSDCAFYIANCAVRLNQLNADDLVRNFVEDYPTSTKRNSAFLDVADYYFENVKYAHSKKWYSQVEEYALTEQEKQKFNFNYGYACFATKDYRNAKKYLSRVENSQKYGSQSKYYIGFMAYEDDDYNKANEYFNQVSDKDKYREELSYYQADLNFKLGNFEKAIELAKEQLPNSDDNEVSELNKIIGESYFNLEKYAEAIPYLTKYKGKNNKWSNTDYYQLGYAHYKQKDYDAAISEFNKIIAGNNSVAQNAYYHLGESYVNVNKKQEALNAFKNASEMAFDKKIQEDAWLNYAKLSYDIGNPYQSVSQVLTSYLDAYPDTAYKEEIETLLIDSYITSKNYKEALKLLKGKNSFDSKTAYQKVAFYRGLELYNEQEFLEARDLFEKSIKESIDDFYTARATFWKAETDYNLTNYDQALIGFKEFLGSSQAVSAKEYENIDYNLAYTYFKLKNYTKATQYFNQFIQNHKDDKVRLNDAYLRLGDGYFVSSNYQSAIDAYSKANEVGELETDYASFQKAMSYGYIGKSSQKISSLENFINQYSKSKLRDDAMFELANSYVKENQTTQAIKMYNSLESEYKMSPLISKAKLRQGLVYYNANQNEQALTQFKEVAAKYPGTPEAVQAVATARLIYIDLGRVNEYANWVKNLDYVEVTNADLDNATYEAAEKKYLDNDTKDAIKQFNGYLNEFPNGLHALQAHFYIAQLYYKQDLKETAGSHYKYVVEASRNEFSEEALARYTQIILDQKQWAESISYLQRLEAEASRPQNILFAQSNLMKAYFEVDNPNKTIEYADKVLQQKTLDNKIKSDAYVFTARAAIKINDEPKARIAYSEVEKIAAGSLAAEALYYNAYFKNKDGLYEQSNQTVQKLAKDYSSQRYYAAKGLVVMAKNFYALKDAYQATYILESVIKNFSDFEDVTIDAQTELKRIKAEQAKTNSSIQNQD